jgi:truncated hemoglobin YjbI
MAQQTDHIGDTNKMITAVEWFYQRILAEDIKTVFEQAKAMEKEQILNACYQFSDYPFNKGDHLEYYNETYKK